MAYEDIPTRLSTDSVPISKDINQLNSNIAAVLGGGSPFDGISTPTSYPASSKYYLYFKSDGMLYKMDSSGVESLVGSVVEKISISEITTPTSTPSYPYHYLYFKSDNKLYQMDYNGVELLVNKKSEIIFDTSAGSKLYYPSGNPAVLCTFIGSNWTVGVKYLSFSDTTDDKVYGCMRLPYDISDYTQIHFEFCGYSATAASGKYIYIVIGYEAIGSNESIDTGVSSYGSALTVLSTQNRVDHKIITKSLTGFSANDLIPFYFSRASYSYSEDTLVGNYNMIHFRVRLS